MKKMLHLLDEQNVIFPPASDAMSKPDGLLAMGGNLEIPTLLDAYASGIFPWFNVGEPLLWWSPNPRMVLSPKSIKISSSLKKTLRKDRYRMTLDAAFEQVIQACSEPRAQSEETWITDEMKQAYIELFRAGHAHSVEVWDGDQLAGGLYGVTIDRVFFGESMFSRQANTSKIALVYLCGHLLQKGYELVDCQVPSQHLASLGAELITRDDFIKLLDTYCRSRHSDAHWKLDWQWTATHQ